MNAKQLREQIDAFKNVKVLKEEKLQRKFTEQELNDIMYEEGVYTDDNETVFEVVSEKIISFDKEKNTVYREFIIKEIATGKFYKAELIDSPWIGMDDYNLNVEWVEVSAPSGESSVSQDHQDDEPFDKQALLNKIIDKIKSNIPTADPYDDNEVSYAKTEGHAEGMQEAIDLIKMFM